MKTINKNIGIPLYEQILEIIYDDIQNGVFSYGEIIPKELDLCKTYNVSRPTIRKALDILVQNGNLIRIKGKGTYVSSDKKIKQDFTHIIQNFNAEMSQKGVSPGTKVLKKLLSKADEQTKEKLNLKNKEKVIELIRLRYADNEPLLIVTTFIPYEKADFLLDKNFEEVSLYDSLEKNNILIKKVVRTFEVQKATKKIADLLTISKNDPVFYFETVAYSDKGIPMEFSKCFYRGDKNKFIVEIEK